MVLTVFECKVCGGTVFPRRYFCPACGASEWREREAGSGAVAESTVVRHRAGAAQQGERYLSTVATDAGPRVISVSNAPLAAGCRVRLAVTTDGAIEATRDPDC
jgi:uncharacterized OB-fold protein